MFFITNNLKYKYLLKLNQKYSNIQYKLNLFFNNKIDNNLKIAVYSYCIKNGGRARMTTLLIIKTYIYSNFTDFKLLYNEYSNSKYVISIIPFENNYLFKKWRISSILMNNFVTYQFNSIIPSDLSENNILLIGRGNDKKKRFEIGVQAMEYIIKDIPECELKIISNLNGIYYLQNLVNNLKLDKNIKFLGYSLIPEIFYKKVKLHFFPTISESFGLVLSEAKLYGIPSILLGLDYVSISKGGTYIIYDDKPETLAKETIKILQNEKYIKELGKEARKAMKIFNNEILSKRWIKLILSVYNGDNYYSELINHQVDYKSNFLSILNNQIKLLQMRNKEFKNCTINDILNFTILKNLF